MFIKISLFIGIKSGKIKKVKRLKGCEKLCKRQNEIRRKAIMNVIQKLFGTHSDRELKRIMPLVEKIESLRPTMAGSYR